MAVLRTPFWKQRKAPPRRNGRPWWGGGEGEGDCHRGKSSETMGGSSECGRLVGTCNTGIVLRGSDDNFSPAVWRNEGCVRECAWNKMK